MAVHTPTSPLGALTLDPPATPVDNTAVEDHVPNIVGSKDSDDAALAVIDSDQESGVQRRAPALDAYTATHLGYAEEAFGEKFWLVVEDFSQEEMDLVAKGRNITFVPGKVRFGQMYLEGYGIVKIWVTAVLINQKSDPTRSPLSTVLYREGDYNRFQVPLVVEKGVALHPSMTLVPTQEDRTQGVKKWQETIRDIARLAFVTGGYHDGTNIKYRLAKDIFRAIKKKMMGDEYDGWFAGEFKDENDESSNEDDADNKDEDEHDEKAEANLIFNDRHSSKKVGGTAKSTASKAPAAKHTPRKVSNAAGASTTRKSHGSANDLRKRTRSSHTTKPEPSQKRHKSSKVSSSASLAYSSATTSSSSSSSSYSTHEADATSSNALPPVVLGFPDEKSATRKRGAYNGKPGIQLQLTEKPADRQFDTVISEPKSTSNPSALRQSYSYFSKLQSHLVGDDDVPMMDADAMLEDEYNEATDLHTSGNATGTPSSKRLKSSLRNGSAAGRPVRVQTQRVPEQRTSATTGESKRNHNLKLANRLLKERLENLTINQAIIPWTDERRAYEAKIAQLERELEAARSSRRI